MLRQIRFLVWEYWSRVYRLFMVALGVGVAACLGAYIFLERADVVTDIDIKVTKNIAIKHGLHFWCDFYAGHELKYLRCELISYDLSLHSD